jgi:hypothetical protein
LGGCRWTRGTIRSRSSAHTTSSGGKYAAGVLDGYSRGTRGVLDGYSRRTLLRVAQPAVPTVAVSRTSL